MADAAETETVYAYRRFARLADFFFRFVAFFFAAFFPAGLRRLAVFFRAFGAAFFFAFLTRFLVAFFLAFFALTRLRAGFLGAGWGFSSGSTSAGGLDQMSRSDSGSGDGLTGGVSGIGSHIPGPPIPVPLASLAIAISLQ